MNKFRHSFSGIVLVAAFAAAPATMAEDFHALSQLSTGTAMPEDQLASIEGTGVCLRRSCNFRLKARATATATATATGTGGSVTFTNNFNTTNPPALLPPIVPPPTGP